MQLERADRSARIADDVELLALILRETGKVRVGQGRVAEARSAFAEARAGLATEGLDNEVVEIESGLAECLAIEGDLDGAERTLVAALATAEAGGHGSVLTSLHCHLGAVRLRRGRRPRRPPRRSKPGWPTPTPATEGMRGRSTCSASPAPAARRPVARAQRPGPPSRRSASSCCPTGSTPSSPDRALRSSLAGRARTGSGAAGPRRCRACSTRSRCRSPQRRRRLDLALDRARPATASERSVGQRARSWRRRS